MGVSVKLQDSINNLPDIIYIYIFHRIDISYLRECHHRMQYVEMKQ